MNIVVTGGAGYIGSHTIIQLFELGFKSIYSLDNYSNSDDQTYDRIEQICGWKPNYVELDVTNKEELQAFFSQHQIDVVIHFAAMKSVPESVEIPLDYYHNNVNGLLNLIECMEANSVKQLIFSSSCSVYGNPDKLPVNENTLFGQAESPYARTKQIGEHIIHDYCRINPSFKAISLRYFNPVGAHESAKIGEGFTPKPNNLVPIITQTAIGIRNEMHVFGSDYNTPDGSCIRDYIHVIDVANAHVKAIVLFSEMDENYNTINLGTGKGTSVLEMIDAFQKISGKKLNYILSDRRAGDVETIYADCEKANTLLKWQTEYDINDMLQSAWQWQQALVNDGISLP